MGKKSKSTTALAGLKHTDFQALDAAAYALLIKLHRPRDSYDSLAAKVAAAAPSPALQAYVGLILTHYRESRKPMRFAADNAALLARRKNPSPARSDVETDFEAELDMAS